MNSALTSAEIKAEAAAIGFTRCGIAKAERHPRLARLASWLAEGRAGEMSYLQRSLAERLDPAQVLPTVRSIVSLAVLYHDGTPPPSAGDIAAGRAEISRYAWGDDYHDIVRARLASLVRWMADRAGSGLEAFSAVDNAPVQERVYAEQAGLGWIGKNTCLINPELGSWLFLAEVFTNADLEPDGPMTDQCGSCTKCLEACPTGAIVEPYTVDATRCLSYLTIETRHDVPERWREAIGPRVYGCDICQDVCPWNRRAPVSAGQEWRPRAGLNRASLLDLCRLNDEAWRGLLKGSAMRRAGLRRLRRSLAYSSRHLPAPDRTAALAALASHPSSAWPEVANAIAWAGQTGRDTVPDQSRMPIRPDQGFSLIELLIVVAIIAVIAAAAVGGLIRSRAAANESSAIASLRVTSSSQKAYAATCGGGAYASSYVVLGTAPPDSAPFISADLGAALTPIKSGFQFQLAPGATAGSGPDDCTGQPTVTAFYATATPMGWTSGSRSFAVTANGTLWQVNGAAAPAEPFGPPAQPIQ